MSTESERKRDSIPPADVMEVVLYPDPRLDKPCRAITAEELKAGKADGWELKELSRRMLATMYFNEGIGLAAPQVGVNLRMFTIDISKDRDQPLTIINPVFTDLEGSETDEEGCLSIPDVRVKVKRPTQLTVTAVDLDGNPLTIKADGLFARCCQHETDHLNGILILKYLGLAGRMLVRRQLNELEERYQMRQARRKR
ncbi:MAG TPA: peptide deformylase [Planctomycetota bacterium]|nr:peptide deformylase [Planctomycetota bacterium]